MYRIEDMKGKDPEKLYAKLEKYDGTHVDRCLPTGRQVCSMLCDLWCLWLKPESAIRKKLLGGTLKTQKRYKIGIIGSRLVYCEQCIINSMH